MVRIRNFNPSSMAGEKQAFRCGCYHIRASLSAVEAVHATLLGVVRHARTGFEVEGVSTSFCLGPPTKARQRCGCHSLLTRTSNR